MTAWTCGTCKHWLTDEREERGACGIDAARWATRWRTKRGYGPGVPETVQWAVAHMTDDGTPACGRWRAFGGKVDG